MSDAVHRIGVTHAAFAGATAARVGAPARDVAVLHLFKYFRPDFTGDGIYFERLFPLLERHGVRNEVAAGITPTSPNTYRDAHLFGNGSFQSVNIRMVFWFLLNAWRFDVVHLHSAVDRFFLYHVIARVMGCRIVQSCTLDDGLGTLVRGYRKSYQWIVRRLCGLIDDLVAISPRLLQDSLNVAGVRSVHFIPQGVEIPPNDDVAQNRNDGTAGITRREHDRTALGVGADDTLLVFVGGICARKDVRFLVDHHPAHTPHGRVHLALVGPALEDGYIADLRAAIAASPAQGRIHLTGYMADPSQAYRAADAFVFASHNEGCPNVVLEAMAHSLPVIARRLPGTTDALVEHGRTGLLFDDAASYQAAIHEIAAHPEARREMGTASLAAVTALYDMDVIARRYATLYRQAA